MKIVSYGNCTIQCICSLISLDKNIDIIKIKNYEILNDNNLSETNIEHLKTADVFFFQPIPDSYTKTSHKYIINNYLNEKCILQILPFYYMKSKYSKHNTKKICDRIKIKDELCLKISSDFPNFISYGVSLYEFSKNNIDKYKLFSNESHHTIILSNEIYRQIINNLNLENLFDKKTDFDKLKYFYTTAAGWLSDVKINPKKYHNLQNDIIQEFIHTYYICHENKKKFFLFNKKLFIDLQNKYKHVKFTLTKIRNHFLSRFIKKYNIELNYELYIEGNGNSIYKVLGINNL